MNIGKEYFKTEIEKTAAQTNEKTALGCLLLCVLTDTHYRKDEWEDTAFNISSVLSRVKTDAIIHLGDFTDGNLSKHLTAEYVEHMMKDLTHNQLPVYVTPGNHDANFLKGNPEPFTVDEQIALFGMEAPYYYKDFEKQKLRCLFLYSYDITTPVRYGFSEEELLWVQRSLDTAPDGYKILVFSHEAPFPWLDYWSHLIRNGERMMDILEDYNKRENCQVLAYFYGHTHAELIYTEGSFPIISIGCNKCEQISKAQLPKGAVSMARDPLTVTQDLWDMVVVNPKEQRIELIRFGAGDNRTIDCHKAESTWRQKQEEKRAKRKPKIWAHRGSSSFAPENSLPAFEIAKALHVDGVTVNVSTTRDGILVAATNEAFQRASEKKDDIGNYTYKELLSFNFALDKPLFGFVKVATLEEVYALFHDTDIQVVIADKEAFSYYTDDVEEARIMQDKGIEKLLTNRPGIMIDQL